MKVDYEDYRDSVRITYAAAREPFLELVEEGFDLAIFRKGQDVLEELREKVRFP
jgi:hypothetical protein